MSYIVYRLKDYLQEKFPVEIRKLPIHTFLGCPHRENRTGKGGCIYCYDSAFSSIENSVPNVLTQVHQGMEHNRAKGFTGKFLAYFQTGTNTYADVTVLEPWFRIIEQYPDDFVGLSVGTRPDCLPPETLALLADLGKKMMVWVELGLQSVHDRTLQLINRGHDYACFVDAVERIRMHEQIQICAHIILGLPGESLDDNLCTIREINRLQLNGIKFHHLQVVKNTVLAEWYAGGKVKVLDREEYIGLLMELLPHLSSKISVHRLVGNVKDDLLLAPRWRLIKARVAQMVVQRMVVKQKFQGMYVDAEGPPPEFDMNKYF